MVPPYQLGHENDEGLRSGAWWFYQKLGFRSLDRATLATMRRELALQRRRPGHRSPPAVLRRLVRANVYWSSGPPRADVLGRFPADALGRAVSARMAERFGSERASGVEVLAGEVGETLGAGARWRRWPADEARAWRRWAPLLACIDDLERWTPREKRALVAVVRAKGGLRESDFVRAFDAHARLRRALARLAGLRRA
jgi:hypothetical protein